MHFNTIFRLLALSSITFCLDSKAEVPSAVSTYLANKSNEVTEAGQLPTRTPEGEAFVHGVVDNWQDIVADLSIHAPTAREQELLAVAAEFLAPRDYIAFIEAVCNAEGATDILISSILIARMIKGGFLAYNFNVPEVAAAINKLEATANQKMPNEWTEFFRSLKSGEARTTIIDERQRYDDFLPEQIDDPGVLENK